MEWEESEESADGGDGFAIRRLGSGENAITDPELRAAMEFSSPSSIDDRVDRTRMDLVATPPPTSPSERGGHLFSYSGGFGLDPDSPSSEYGGSMPPETPVKTPQRLRRTPDQHRTPGGGMGGEGEDGCSSSSEKRETSSGVFGLGLQSGLSGTPGFVPSSSAGPDRLTTDFKILEIIGRGTFGTVY